ncbi:hypothetical protein [Tessaracoccus massiliensis]|uniref:hypothetical protein n=1 Tax=Tessaracoccus massiliensis TaxID=1522311 RepID=UPI00058D187F|nr:hypothetical protein [Tessaracoccus massiliensis]
MVEGHPVVWLGIVGVVTAVALGVPDPLASAALTAALALSGLIARGPRAASFVLGAAAALGCALVWLGWLFLVPTASVATWLTGALAAASVCLALGVAGQAVCAREWLSLATLTGPFAPALGWLCCGGEAAAELAARRRQGRRAGGLTGWLTTTRDLAEGLPGASPGRLLALRGPDLAQLLALALLAAAVVLRPQYGSLPLVAAALTLPLSLAVAMPRREARSA